LIFLKNRITRVGVLKLAQHPSVRHTVSKRTIVSRSKGDPDRDTRDETEMGPRKNYSPSGADVFPVQKIGKETAHLK